MLGAFVLVSTLPNIHYAWDPGYNYGLSVTPQLTVDGVVPGDSADRAGVRVGDKIDQQSLSYADLLGFFGSEPTAGERVTATFLRGDRRLTVHLIAEQGAPTFYTRVIVPIKRIVSLVFIFIGALLVLRRPGRMTWSFYLFALGSTTATAFVYGRLPPPEYNALNAALYAIYGGASTAFLGFACRFPTDQVTGWRHIIDRWVPFVYVTAASLGALSWLSRDHAIAVPFRTIYRISNILDYFLIALGVVVLLATYAKEREQRQRIKWLIASLVLAGLSIAFIDFLSPLFPTIPGVLQTYWNPDDLAILNIFVPLAVAYAVLHHRVLDVNFIISRALVYAVLTSMVVALFAVLDWFFVRKLLATNLGVLIEIAVAIALGFWLNAVHRRVDGVVDRVFFRRRYLAELRLARIAAVLPHATSEASVDSLLISEPTDAFELASAALFARSPDGTYARKTAIGWGDDCTIGLGADDPVVLHLRSGLALVRLSEVRWPRDDLPRGAGYPALALPIVVRNHVVAIALYGAHKNQADLDPDEISAISNLAPGAGAAYDHLQAESMQREVDLLKSKVESLQAQLAEAQIQPA